MQHISAWGEELRVANIYTHEILTEAELSGLTWKVITAKKSSIESAFFCYDLRLTSQRPAQHKEFFFVNKTSSFEKKWKAECTH